ncbi:MAG: ABC transporter permease [Patescibacteria group bacterium]|nr:ABC transporter permease [Patescibacteria group bacterium]
MFIEILLMAFESLKQNKTRTLLSMLGVIIGVSTVIAVFAIGQGAQSAVDEQFAGLSAKSILVMGTFSRGATASSKLEIKDVKLIREQAKNIGRATGITQGSVTVSYNSLDSSFTVIGTDIEYFAISNLELNTGRLFTEEEMNDKAKVVLLGSGVVETLFEDGVEPIGAIINAGGKKFEVIGIFEETGSSLGKINKDESIYIPYQTAQSSILGSGGRIMLTLEATTVDTVVTATEEITAILRKEHGLKSSQADDFKIMDAGSMVGAAQESATLMTTVLTLVAAIVLIVSGIGIMNVMFVTVAERTKEIGIAKAIGAKQGDILFQFLYESIILSAIGGLVGVGLGQGAIPLISKYGGMLITNTVTGPLLGFGFSALVGITFGFYPALKASRLDPVDALRSE